MKRTLEELVVTQGLSRIPPNQVSRHERELVKTLAERTPFNAKELYYLLNWWKPLWVLEALLGESGERPHAMPMGSEGSARKTGDYKAAHEKIQNYRAAQGMEPENPNLLSPELMFIEGQINAAIKLMDRNERLNWSNPENCMVLYDSGMRKLDLHTASRRLGASHGAIVGWLNFKAGKTGDNGSAEDWKEIARFYRAPYTRELRKRPLTDDESTSLIDARWEDWEKWEYHDLTTKFRKEFKWLLYRLPGGIRTLDDYLILDELADWQNAQKDVQGGTPLMAYYNRLLQEINSLVSKKIIVPDLRQQSSPPEYPQLSLAMAVLKKGTEQETPTFPWLFMKQLVDSYIRQNPPKKPDLPKATKQLQDYTDSVVKKLDAEVDSFIFAVVNAEVNGKKINEESLTSLINEALSSLNSRHGVKMHLWSEEYKLLKLRFYGKKGKLLTLEELRDEMGRGTTMENTRLRVNGAVGCLATYHGLAPRLQSYFKQVTERFMQDSDSFLATVLRENREHRGSVAERIAV